MRAKILLLILLASSLPPVILAPTATAAEAGFIVKEVWRQDTDADVVWFTLTNHNGYLTDVTVSLQNGQGVLVATPERFHTSWGDGERKNLNFNLIEDVSTAKLVFRYDNTTEEVRVAIPDAPTGNWGSPRVRVMSAELSNGTVNLTVENTGNAHARDVLVSIEDHGVKVGDPIYRHVESLSPGEGVLLRYDVDDTNRTLTQATVVVEHNGEEEETIVGLRRGDGGGGGGDGNDGEPEGNVTLSAELPYLEAEPGQTVRFNLRLENRYEERSLDLQVEDLPEGFRTNFLQGRNRVSRLVMDGGETRSLALEVSIPSNVDDVGGTVPVPVVVTSEGEEQARTELSITLQGQGSLSLQLTQSLAEVKPGESTTVTATLENTGSGPLRSVRVSTDLPSLGWRVKTNPDRIYRFDAGESREIKLVITAPEDAGEGQSPIDVVASARGVDDRTRTLTVDVAPAESSGLLWVLLVGVVLVGVVAIIVKVRRR